MIELTNITSQSILNNTGNEIISNFTTDVFNLIDINGNNYSDMVSLPNHIFLGSGKPAIINNKKSTIITLVVVIVFLIILVTIIMIVLWYCCCPSNCKLKKSKSRKSSRR